MIHLRKNKVYREENRLFIFKGGFLKWEKL